MAADLEWPLYIADTRAEKGLSESQVASMWIRVPKYII